MRVSQIFVAYLQKTCVLVCSGQAQGCFWRVSQGFLWAFQQLPCFCHLPLPSSLRPLLGCHLEQPNRGFCLIKASTVWVACQAHHPLPGWPCRCPCTCPDIPLPSPDSGLLIASPHILTSEPLPTLFPLPESPPRLLSLWRFHSLRENTKIAHSHFTSPASAVSP